MPPQDAVEFFESIVGEYDSLIQRGLPRYEEMLAELVRSLPAQADDVLELGCGTGALTLLLAKRYPNAHLTVVDGVAKMVDVTRRRLTAAHSDVADHAVFRVSRFEDLQIDAGAYDCITASMSLHHLQDKVPFYGALQGALRDGGVLAFADELCGAVPYMQQLHWNDWIAYARQPGHLNEAEIGDIIKHMDAFDRYETLPDQLRLLTDAGFGSVDCVWRRWNYGVFVAAV
jgi:ubiquinone/menaquinone biosynthesis C-methylase UbiE